MEFEVNLSTLDFDDLASDLVRLDIREAPSMYCRAIRLTVCTFNLSCER